MTLTLAQVEFLRSFSADFPPPITPTNHLKIATQFAKQYGKQNATALIETAILRERAREKFSRADEMLFERAGLEMSSAEIITRYRGRRYAPFAHVADLGCGLGGDAIGLAQHAHVHAIDRDPVRLALTQHNLAVYDRASNLTTRQADLLTLVPFPVDALFFDPARRDERGKRIYSLSRYRPPLTILEKWRNMAAAWGVKVSPAVDLGEVDQSAEIEFISVNGDLREAILWYGDLRMGAKTTATLLPSGATLSSVRSNDLQRPLSTPQTYLYEPDPAILRARLVRPLATQLNAQQIDETIAFLTSDDKIDTPFANRFYIEDWFPFQLKRLRTYLRERRIGQVTLKKRGSPLDVEQLRRQLRLKGKETRTLILTHVQRQPAVIICSPLHPSL